MLFPKYETLTLHNIFLSLSLSLINLISKTYFCRRNDNHQQQVHDVRVEDISVQRADATGDHEPAEARSRWLQVHLEKLHRRRWGEHPALRWVSAVNVSTRTKTGRKVSLREVKLSESLRKLRQTQTTSCRYKLSCRVNAFIIYFLKKLVMSPKTDQTVVERVY